MKLIAVLTAVFALGAFAAPPQQQVLRLRVPAGAHEVLKRIELAIEGVPGVSNPFDPEEIAVELEATAPSDKQLILPAFWGREFERQLEGDREVLTPKGEAGWRVRYLPLEPGNHALEVVARRGQEVMARGSTVIHVEASTGRGLVRQDSGSRYFRFDDGTPFFLNGLCACWHGRRGTFDYDDWLAAYEESGINYIRLWMWPQAFGIEWDKGDRLNYRLDTAWTVDRVLGEAERRGIYVMLCFDYHGMYEVKPDYWNSNNFWPRHPYNLENGGPCATQDEFFTKAEAQDLYRKRLRYIVARWSSFRSVFAWEFFNEIDNAYAYVEHDHVVAWHQRMGAHLRSIDPYQHLISSSFTGGSERPDLYALKEMEFSQYHSYNEKHPAEMTASKARAFWDRYGKPFYVSEYGTDWKGWKPDTDPELRALHQAVWSGAFTGAAGTGMTWWWESIHSAGLYKHWSALAGFLKGTAIASSEMRPIAAEASGEKAKVWAVATPRQALIWVLDPAMNWPEGATLSRPNPLQGVEIVLEGLEDGSYAVDWWDTLGAGRLSGGGGECEAGRLVLSVPEFQVDVAARVTKR